MKNLSFNIGDQFLGEGHFLSQTTGVGTLISTLYSNAIVIAGIILVFLLIYAGSKIQQKWENPEAVKEGQKIITYSLLGFVLIIAAWFLIRVLEGSTGTVILNN